MKKLFLLLAAVGIIFTACESGGSVEEENGGNAPTLKIELSKQTVDVDFETGTYSISVTSPYSWRASSDNDWIIVNSKTGIAGTKELKFSVKRNEEEEIREGTIVIKNEDYNLIAELYVVQKSFTPSIVIEPEALSFTVEGGEQNIAVTANFEYEISTSADWVSYKKTEKGLTITVPNYTEVKERSAVVTISSEKYKISKTIKVAQGAFVPEITIDTEIIEFAAKSGAKDVAITANFEYEVSTSASWVTYSKKQNGITVSVPNYGKIEERTANITISSGMYNISKTIKIRQKGLTEEEYAEQILVYTSSDGMVVTPNNYFFGANVVSNTYKNGQGVILFDAPITSIGECAFYDCTSLTSVTIPNSVTSIGDFAFGDCYSLTSVTIPNSVTSIGSSAFYMCVSLTSVIIPNSVTSIGNSAFRCCTSLTSVTIPDGVTSIGKGAFSGCTGELIINSKVVGMDWEYKNLESHWLYGSEFSKVTIGGNVTRIGEYVFCSYSSLISVTIPDSVTSIGVSAFYDCDSLTSVTIPNSVTSIGGGAFSYCTSLTSVTIPNSVTSIGDSVFYYCDSLTSVTIPNSVTSIGDSAFYECYSLKSVTIPNSVKKIGESAFGGCNSLTSVTIGNGVTSIGEEAFTGCISLKSVTIGNGVTSIGDRAFSYCSSLKSVTIPDSVTSIGGYAFSFCTSLTSVYCKPTTPPAGGIYMFEDSASGRKIYVPRASVDAYKSAEYWWNYSSNIVGYDF